MPGDRCTRERSRTRSSSAPGMPPDSTFGRGRCVAARRRYPWFATTPASRRAGSRSGGRRPACSRTDSESAPMTSPTNVRISRREGFNAAHQLQDASLSEDENRHLYGKCVNLHGHNYVLEVVVSGAIDPGTGYVMDLKRLSDLMVAEVIQHVDHRNLNTDVTWLQGRIPTAENLALACWARLLPHLPP